MVKVKLIKFL